MRPGRPGGRSRPTPSAGRLLGLVGAALWRAQASHLLVFVLVPAVAALAQAALGIVLLPFLLAGEGTRDISLSASASHLSQAGCWLALAPCPLADRSLVEFPSASPERPGPAASPTTPPEAEPFLPMPTGLTVRHAWFLAWLAWFLAHLVRRERGRGEAGP